jgi:hypothetical protein
MAVLAYVNLSGNNRLPPEAASYRQEATAVDPHVGDLRTCHRNPYTTGLTDYDASAPFRFTRSWRVCRKSSP